MTLTSLLDTAAISCALIAILEMVLDSPSEAQWVAWIGLALVVLGAIAKMDRAKRT